MTRPYQNIDEAAAKETWDAWKKPFVWDKETIDWLNTRPQKIIDMVLRFPPDAKVKGLIPLDCPKPNEFGIVASYFEDGLVSVVVPGRPMKAQCQLDWLEIVEYRQGMSPDDIRKHLKKGTT